MRPSKALPRSVVVPGVETGLGVFADGAGVSFSPGRLVGGCGSAGVGDAGLAEGAEACASGSDGGVGAGEMAGEAGADWVGVRGATGGGAPAPFGAASELFVSVVSCWLGC